MRLTLRDAGVPAYKKICRGRKWIGRVGPIGADQSPPPPAGHRYFGKIGNLFVTAPDERSAFSLVCARYFGHDDPASLAAHNARVRAVNRANRARNRVMADRMLRGDFSVIDEMFRRHHDEAVATDRSKSWVD